MGRNVVVHQINAMSSPALDLVRFAAEAGCQAVSVFTNCPDAVLPGQSQRLDFPTVTPAAKREMQRALARYGVEVVGVEYFPILPDLDVREYIPGLALGAELGGTRAVTHIHDINRARAVDAVGRLCELAASEGLSVGVEFTPMTGGCRSLQDAAELIDQVGRADFAIGLDCLHFVRSGATVADITRLGARYFNNVQICDGHGLHQSTSYMEESHDREMPGRGDFPLLAILNALPASLPIEIEVPNSHQRDMGASAQDHIRDAVSSVRSIVARLAQTR